MAKRTIPPLVEKELKLFNAEQISSIETNSTSHPYAVFRLPDGRTFKWSWMGKHPGQSAGGSRSELNNRSQLRRMLCLDMGLERPEKKK